MKNRNFVLSLLIFVFLTASGCVADGYYHGYSGYRYGYEPHGYFGYYPYSWDHNRHGDRYFREDNRRHYYRRDGDHKRFYRSPRNRDESRFHSGDRPGRGTVVPRGGSFRGHEKFQGHPDFGVNKEGH